VAALGDSHDRRQSTYRPETGTQLSSTLPNEHIAKYLPVSFSHTIDSQSLF
jgi:hypothetical protein